MKDSKSELALNSAVFMLMFGVGMVVALLPGRILDLGGSAAQTGLIASSLAVSFILVVLPLGWLADRLGPKPWLIACYALVGASGVFYFLGDCVELIWLGRIVQGLGEAPVWALAPALLTLINPMNPGRSFGLYNASLHLGLTLGPLGGALLAGALAVPHQFLGCSMLCCLGAGLITLQVKPLKARPVTWSPNQGRTLPDIFTRPARFYLLGGILLYGAAYGLCLTVLPAHLAKAAQFDAQDNGLFFCLFYLGLSLSQAGAGYISRSRCAHAVGSAGMLLAGCGLGGLPWLAPGWVLMALPWASLGLGAFSVCSLTRMSAWAAPQAGGPISGLYYLAWGMGYFFAPLSWAFLSELAGGFQPLWLGFAGLLAAYGGLAVLLIRPSGPR